MVIPAVLLSRDPGVSFVLLYFCTFVHMACGHQRRGASPTPDQEETNGCSLLELPAATSKLSEKR